MRLLAKDPGERFASCAELDQALASCESACRDVPALSKQQAAELTKTLGASATAAQPGSASHGKSGNKQALALGGAFVAAVLLVGGVIVLAPKRPRPAAIDTVTKPAADPGQVVKPADPPKPADPGQAPAQSGTAATGTAEVKPTSKPAGKSPESGSSATAAAASPTGSKPSVGKPSGSGATAKEPAEVKEKLDEAEALLRKGTYEEAAGIAIKTTFTAPTPRAYRQLVTAYCNMGDLNRATTYFHRVAAADKRALIALCRKHDIDLH
jgi:hypothetical protein